MPRQHLDNRTAAVTPATPHYRLNTPPLVNIHAASAAKCHIETLIAATAEAPPRIRQYHEINAYHQLSSVIN